jgi:hypothetical protein
VKPLKGVVETVDHASAEAVDTDVISIAYHAGHERRSPSWHL